MYRPDDITLYIPCHNAEQTLPDVIDAVKRQTVCPAHILLVDDGSRSSLPSFPGVNVIVHERNRGLATARNTALDHCGTKLLAALDSDVRPEPSWLENMLTALNSGPYSGVGGRMDELYTDSLANRWRARHMAQHWGTQPVENPRFLYGANTLYRTDALRLVNGYDGRHRTNDEDRSMSDALYELGHKLFYAPDAHCHHLRQDTLESILQGYWRWHYTRGLLRGDFEKAVTLIDPRMENVNFGIFRYRFDTDDKANRHDFMALDMSIPWVFCAQDLLFFALRHNCDVPVFPEPNLLRELEPSVRSFILRQIPTALANRTGNVSWSSEYYREFRRLLREYEWYSVAYERDVVRQTIREIETCG